jgi:hydroxyacylglutathione hydrolase
MDNYSYLIHDEKSNKTAVIDPSELKPILKKCEEKNWKIDYVLNTHHHYDHTDFNIAIKEKFNAIVIGAKSDERRIPGIDRTVDDGDIFDFGENKAKIIDAPGHTIGHILWYFEDAKVLFTGDVLFNLGIGGLFEGTSKQMWNTLSKIKALPDDVKIYCGHEYTLHCARNALHMEPKNQMLIDYVHDAQSKRANNEPTVPTTVYKEKNCNPYLRADDENFQKRLGLYGLSPEKVFAHLVGEG